MDIGQAVAEDPLVKFEKILPQGFIGEGGGGLLGGEIIGIAKQPLKAFQLLAAIGQGDDIGVGDLRAGQLGDKLGVKIHRGPELVGREQHVLQLFVGDVEFLIVWELHQLEVE